MDAGQAEAVEADGVEGMVGAVGAGDLGIGVGGDGGWEGEEGAWELEGAPGGVASGGVDVEAVVAHEFWELESWLLCEEAKGDRLGELFFINVVETLFNVYHAFVVPLSGV